MKSTTHRVVILNNVKSEIISQAILVLKSSDGLSESAVLAEAERVVEKYMQNGGYSTEEKKSRLALSFLGAAAVIFAGICIFAVIKGVSLIF